MERSYEKEGKKYQVEERNKKSGEKGIMKGFWISSNTQEDAEGRRKKIERNYSQTLTQIEETTVMVFLFNIHVHASRTGMVRTNGRSEAFDIFQHSAITVSHAYNFPYYVTT